MLPAQRMAESDLIQRHGEFIEDQDGFSPTIRTNCSNKLPSLKSCGGLGLSVSDKPSPYGTQTVPCRFGCFPRATQYK